METKEYKKSEISDWQIWKWKIEDWIGLKLHQFIAWASNDEEVKKLYKEMEKALLQEGDQPKASRISNEIRTKIELNTHKRAEKLNLRGN